VKAKGAEFFGWSHDDVHVASYDMKARVALLDEHGLHAQVVYPNLAGFGNQNFLKVEDNELRKLCATVYNDAMAEFQADSGDRVLPMALMPWWNVADCVDEVQSSDCVGS
jgi:predicted TIM-barrel fold metal-dependent hydrolase